MYHQGKPPHGPLPFGPPRHRGPPYVHGRPCGPPPHLDPGPGGPFQPPDDPYLYDRPPGRHFIGPHCSNFPVDHSREIALGGPPAEQVPPWNPTPVERHFQDNSDRAGEEFLRCIAANKPLPNYLKGDMAFNLAEALQSANVLRDAFKSDTLFQSHVTSSKSRSRSRGRSRGKSRAKSSAPSRSRGRSKSRPPSRSRGRSKSRPPSRSRGRSKSRIRGKSRVRSKSRSRSQSYSRSKKRDPVRSKSQVRRSKSRSISREKSHSGRDKKRKRSPSHSFSSSNDLTSNSLLEGLKLVMSSKELEERLPSLKDAILTIQGSDETKKVERAPEVQHNNQDEPTSFDNDSMLLPHERVVSDFSWLQGQSHEDSTAQKAAELEAEESFLYGSEDTGEKQASSSHTAAVPMIGKQAKPQEMDILGLGSNHSSQNKPLFPTFDDLMQPQQMTSSNLASVNLDSSDNEKIKNLLKGLGTAEIREMMMKVQGQKDGKQHFTALSTLGTTLSDPNVRQALESLQSLIKVTKEKRIKSDGNCASQTSDKHKAGEDEDIKIMKQARMAKMEILMNELGGLMNQDGLSFLTPVIGFYCQRCEEFIGDLKSAENHATTHHSNSRTQKDMHAGDSKKCMSYFSSRSNQHTADRRDPRDQDQHRGSAESRDQDHRRGSAESRDQDHRRGSAESRDQDHRRGSADPRDQDQHRGSAESRDQDQHRGSAESRDQDQHRGSAESRDQDQHRGSAESRDQGGHRGTADSKSHLDHRRDQRDERANRNKQEDDLRSHRAKQENLSMQEEMRKERMLITVSQGQALLTNVRVKEEPKKELEPHGRKEKEMVNSDSSDISDNEREKSRKTKLPKKKKKKKKDKKKKEKKKNS